VIDVTATAGLQLLFFGQAAYGAVDHWEMHDFLEIVGLSISVSLTATAVATAISLPIGTALAFFFAGGVLLSF
jgi:hypothetical protein